MSRACKRALVGASLVVASLVAATSARGDDPKKQSLTVLLPTPVDAPAADANLIFTSDEKRLTLSVTYAFPSLVSVSARISAPLDGDSRIARFLAPGNPAFEGELSLGYDSRRAMKWRTEEAARVSLALSPEERTFEDLKLCEANQIEPCSQSQIVRWMRDEHCRSERGCTNAQLERVAPLQMAMERRNLLVSNIPSTLRNVEYWVGGDLAVGYDKLGVYRNDLALAPTDVTKYDVQLGANAALFLFHAFAINLRAGGEVARAPSLERVERCQAIASTDPTVTGRACDKNALFMSGALPAAAASAYVRFALDYEFHKSKLTRQDIIPGVEGRVGVERLGQSPSLDLRFTVFFTPVIDPIAGQFGVGVDWSYALETSAARPAGQTTVVPFAFVGARPAPILK
ncbi:MAG: hypothetical protein JWN44_1587 [Myxococcales bacterium]|nr:hypothetical protein [Myxococcales bacterium]